MFFFFSHLRFSFLGGFSRFRFSFLFSHRAVCLAIVAIELCLGFFFFLRATPAQKQFSQRIIRDYNMIRFVITARIGGLLWLPGGGRNKTKHTVVADANNLDS